MRARVPSVLIALLVLGGCTTSSPPSRAAGPGHGGTAASPPNGSAPTLADQMRACPVTRPNGSTPPGVRSRWFFGGDGLWTLLWPHGLVVVPEENVRADGALGMKFPWWRGPGVSGYLRISGQGVGSQRPVTARTAGYGLTGFNASAIFFPTEGCYRVTGRAGEAEITFVTLVRTCSVLPELPPVERRRLAAGCG